MINKQTPAEWLDVPLSSGMLGVGEAHAISWRSFGQVDAMPVLVLHGGPGSGSNARHLSFFDPRRHRVIMFDQRGSGESTPAGATTANTTADLIADIEQLRQMLGIDRWLVFGVSWGACLAVLYAQTHPVACSGVVLSGLSNRHDWQTRWILETRARLLPERHDAFLGALPPTDRADPIAAWYRLSQSSARADQLLATYAVWVLEEGLEGAEPESLPAMTLTGIDPAMMQRARIYLHYWAHKTFLTHGQLLFNPGALATMPVVMVHGEADWVCPLSGARQFADSVPSIRLVVVPKAGHSAYDSAVTAVLRDSILALSGAG